MRTVLIAITTIILALAVALWWLFTNATSPIDVRFELAKAILNLVTALLITGVLSVALSRRSIRESRMDDHARVLITALQELKSGYESTQAARFFLAAHMTGKTFDEQIPTILEARAHLQRVQRERFIINTTVDSAAQNMLNYLTAIALEYRTHYASIARDSLIELRQRAVFLDSGEVGALSAIPMLAPE